MNKWATVVGVTIVSMVFVGLLGAGCKRKSTVSAEPQGPAGQTLPGVVTNRMQDASYREELKQNMKEQRSRAKDRNEVVDRMTVLIAEARTKLPAGADDAAVKAELAKNAEWRDLEAKNQQLVGEIDKTLARARETVRQRMLQEAQDAKAVAEGKAQPVGETAAAK